MSTFLYVCGVAVVFVGLAVLWGGLGLLARRAFGLRLRTADDLALGLWVGWCVGLVLLQAWHLFLPADGRALAFLGVVSVGAMVWNRADIAAWCRGVSRRDRGFAVLLLLTALWLANQTTTQPTHFDAGHYHLLNIKWAHLYPIVPGLGNLRNLLAYNQSYFLYVSILDGGPFALRSHHLASGGVLYLLYVRAWLALWRLLAGRGRPEAWRIFDVMLLMPATVCAMGVNGSSPTPDVGVWALCLVIASEVLRLLGEAEWARELVRTDGEEAGAEVAPRLFALPCEVRYAVLTIVFLAAVSVTVKLSAAVFGAVACVLAVAAARTPGRAGRILDGRAWVWMAAVSVGVAVLWMVRGVITSGYPLYPSTLLGFPADWRMPEEIVWLNLRWNLAWGRWYGYGMDGLPERIFTNWSWLWLWFNRLMRCAFTILMPLLMAVCVAPFILLACRAPAERQRQPRLSWWFLAMPVASLAYWFITFPDPRHGEAALLALGMGSLALALRRMETGKVLAVAAAVNIALFALSVDPFSFLRQWQKDTGPVRKGDVVPVETESGLTVYVPREGHHPWDAPLPATTSSNHVNPKLRLRVPGDLSKGFAIGE